MEMLGGVFVVAETSGFALNGTFSPKTVGVVHQMAQHTAVVSIMHVAVGQFRLAFAAGRDKRTPSCHRA